VGYGKQSRLYIAYGVKTDYENEKSGYNHPLPDIKESRSRRFARKCIGNGLKTGPKSMEN
jgi:hypothetical protein